MTPAPSGIEIRPSRLGDELAIAVVHVASWQTGYRGIFDDAFLDALRPEQRVDRYTLGLDTVTDPHTDVAVDHDGFLGAFVTTMACRDAAAKGMGELAALYVHPSWWGRGIGRLLLAHGTDRLRVNGFTTAVLWVLKENDRARGLYESSGWEWDGSERQETPWGVLATVQRLRLSLLDP